MSALRMTFALALAATLAACDTGEVVASSNVRMEVVANRGLTKRFWVTLVDQDGTRWDQVRLGGKRCRQGPSNLPPGREIMVQVDTVRYKDGRSERRIDRAEMRDRFC